MEELIKRKESIDHLKHSSKKDPNLIIYKSYVDSGETDKAARFLEYRKRWEAAGVKGEVPSFPYFVTFGLNNSCNLSCAHCYRTFNKDSSKKSLLEYDEVVRLITECKSIGVPSIALGSESEVFTYKRASDVIMLIASQDFADTWICTNGTLLDDDRIDLILDSNITRLTISIDAITKETYKKVRGGDFDKLMSNISNFLNKRKMRNRRLPVLRVTFVKYNLTEHEEKEFVDHWSGVADEVDVQPLVDIKNVDILRHKRVDNISCIYPNRMMYINWNGDYKPCCAEFCKHLTIGNIKDMGVLDAWNSEYMKDLRLQLNDRKPLNKACINCLKSLHSTEVYTPLA